jgi:spermidine synthase
MKRLLSYIWPVRLKNYPSRINGRLEINLINGRKTLDSGLSNYSYGSLQRILHKGLTEIGLDNKIKNILLLGLGGGSVIETIREEFDCKAAIEAVDIDPEIITIAKDEFQINRFNNVLIMMADAAEYVAKSKEAFDLIIVDLFIGNTVPEVFTKSEFINHLIRHLKANGRIIYNSMIDTMPSESLASIKETFIKSGLNVKVIEKVEVTNNLIIAGKYQ